MKMKDKKEDRERVEELFTPLALSVGEGFGLDYESVLEEWGLFNNKIPEKVSMSDLVDIQFKNQSPIIKFKIWLICMCWRYPKRK